MAQDFGKSHIPYLKGSSYDGKELPFYLPYSLPLYPTTIFYFCIAFKKE